MPLESAAAAKGATVELTYVPVPTKRYTVSLASKGLPKEVAPVLALYRDGDTYVDQTEQSAKPDAVFSRKIALRTPGGDGGDDAGEVEVLVGVYNPPQGESISEENHAYVTQSVRLSHLLAQPKGTSDLQVMPAGDEGSDKEPLAGARITVSIVEEK